MCYQDNDRRNSSGCTDATAYEAIKKNHPTVPTLIVEGKSANNRYSNQPEILKYLPNGKLKVLEDCGHMLNMEQPEAFNAALREFLKQ